MLRDQVIRLEKVQEVGHELERLADPKAAKYATAAAAVTTSATAGLRAKVTEHESQQHTRASIIASSSNADSIDRHIWLSPADLALHLALLCCVCFSWFCAGKAHMLSERLDHIGARLDPSCKKLDAAKEGRQ